MCAYTPTALVGRPKLTVPTNALTILANVPLVGVRQYSIPIQVADGYLFDQRWDRYYFAVVGLIRHLDLEGDRYAAPSPGPDHSLRLYGGLRLIGSEPQLEIAPWWQVAYIPKRGGGEPPLVPQLRWWPGCGGGVALSFRDNLPRDRIPTKADLKAAIEARRLLLMVGEPARSPGPHAMSNADAFEEAVNLGIEWLNDHPGKHPKDFGITEFTAKRCTGPDATARWMKEKHFGIKQVQRAIARRVRWPT